MRFLLRHAATLSLRLVVIMALLFACSQVKADTLRTSVDGFVQHWNKLYNAHDIGSIRKLYSDEVWFYGNTISKDVLDKHIKKAGSKQYSQQLLSNVRVSSYQSGRIKASFSLMRSTDSAGARRTYLVLEPNNNSFVIVAESDMITDRQVEAPFVLGEEQRNYEGETPPLLLLLGVAGSVIALLYFLMFKMQWNSKGIEPSGLHAPLKPVTQMASVPVATTVATAAASNAKVAVAPSLQPQHLEEPGSTNEKAEFAGYIASLLSQGYEVNQLTESGSHSAASYAQPDFEVSITTNDNTHGFAIKCLWVERFDSGHLSWCSHLQYKSLLDYEYKTRHSLFLIIGIGASPSNPAQMIIIPLRRIRSQVIEHKDAMKYVRINTGPLVYKPNGMFLE